MPAVAVIIPAYNAARYLAEAVTSVQRQTLPDWRLVVVDDGSTDETLDLALAIAREDPRVTVAAQANQGPSAAREHGFTLSEGSPFVLFLDADDVLEPHALATLQSALEQSPESSAAHGLARHIDSLGSPIRPGQSERWTRAHRKVRRGLGLRHLRDDEPTAFQSLVMANAIQAPGAVLVRRAAKLAAGPYDGTLAHSEDYDMWIRLACIGPIAFCPTIVLRYRKHDSNRSGDRKGLAIAGEVVRRKAYSRAAGDRDLWPALVRSYRAHQRHLARSKVAFALDEARCSDARGAIRQLRFGAGHLRRSLGSPPISPR